MKDLIKKIRNTNFPFANIRCVIIPLSIIGWVQTVPRSRKSLTRILSDERGSISILVMGLFMVTLGTIMVLTNISAVYMAKKSLTQATESAAQYALGNLDNKSYYNGEFSNVTLLQNLVGVGPEDPGIPIDCNHGMRDVGRAMHDWFGGNKFLVRSEIKDLSIDHIDCDGYTISIRSSANAQLPFQGAIFGIKEVHISSQVKAINERKGGLYLFGMRIGS